MVDDYQHLFDDNGQIRPEKVEDLLVEIVSGRYIYSRSDNPEFLLASRCPTAKEQDNARIVFAKSLRIANAKGLMLRADLEKVALDQELFIPGERQEKLNLIQMLERQHRAKENTGDERQKAQLTTEIEFSRKRIIEIEMREFQILRHSAEVKAEEARFDYYTACCTLAGEMLDEPLWKDFSAYQKTADWTLLHDARRALHRVQGGLPVAVIRGVARTGEWRVRWKSCRESGTQPFEGSAPNWDRNKVNLIYWSDFYDNIYQHPESPDEMTIQDDESLGRWINQQVARRKQQQSMMPQAGNRRSPTYIQGGIRKQMAKVGADQKINVGTPFKVRS